MTPNEEPAGPGTFLGEIDIKCLSHKKARPLEFYHPAACKCRGAMRAEHVRWLLEKYGPEAGIVMDPMCGSGTTLIEALRLGYCVMGLELEKTWAAVAVGSCRRTGKTLGLAPPAPGGCWWRVIRGDAQVLSSCYGPWSEGRKVSMALWSVPFGPTNHSAGKGWRQRQITEDRHAWHGQEYGGAQGNLGDPKQFTYTGFLDGMSNILAQVSTVMIPGANVLIHCRRFVKDRRHVDLPGDLATIAEACVGWTLMGHHTAPAQKSMFRSWKESKDPTFPRIRKEFVLWFKTAG